MSNMDDARSEMNYGSVTRAAVYAQLALADAIAGLKFAPAVAEPVEQFPMAHALTRKESVDAEVLTVMIYLDKGEAIAEAAKYNQLAKDAGSTVQWGVTTYPLNPRKG